MRMKKHSSHQSTYKSSAFITTEGIKSKDFKAQDKVLESRKESISVQKSLQRANPNPEPPAVEKQVQPEQPPKIVEPLKGKLDEFSII